MGSCLVKLFKLVSLMCMVAVLVGVLLIVWCFWVEPNMLTVTHLHLPVKQWEGTERHAKIVLAADFHCRADGKKRLDNIVSEILAQKPDIIVLSGDFMVRNAFAMKVNMSVNDVAEGLRPLSRVPCFFVMGNHDTIYGYKRVRQALENVGLQCVERRSLIVPLKSGGEIAVGGVYDYTMGEVWPKDVPRKPEGHEKAPLVMLAHTPDVMKVMRGEVDFLLCGHTHGGQVRLPFYGALIVSTEALGREYAYGLFPMKQGGKMFVTRGLGESDIPIRFWCPPEIVVLHLSGNPKK